jgi:hypothetical protein
MCISKHRRRGRDMHQLAKNKRDRYASVGLGEEGQMCTSRLRIRGRDVHQQAKNKRDGYAPAG